jgi:hypothetical protein
LSSTPPSFSFTPSPHSWNSFNRYHFYIYIYVYTVFVLHSPSYTLSLLLFRSLVPIPTPTQDLFHLPFVQFCKRKKWYFCLLKITIKRVSLYIYIYIYICKITQIVSSFYLSPLSYGDFKYGD